MQIGSGLFITWKLGDTNHARRKCWRSRTEQMFISIIKIKVRGKYHHLYEKNIRIRAQ